MSIFAVTCHEYSPSNRINQCTGLRDSWQLFSRKFDQVFYVGIPEFPGHHACIKIFMQFKRRISHIKKNIRCIRYLQRIKRAIANGEGGDQSFVRLLGRSTERKLHDVFQNALKTEEIGFEGNGGCPCCQLCSMSIPCQEHFRICTSIALRFCSLKQKLSIGVSFLLSSTRVGSMLLNKCNDKGDHSQCRLSPGSPLTLRNAEPPRNPAAIVDRISHATSPVSIGTIVCGALT